LSSIMSYVGWMEHANTKKLMYKYISEALVWNQVAIIIQN
jgi:hypothetical protein